MEEQDEIVILLKDIKRLLSHTKKTMNINDLVKYTGLSKSKIYKLSQLKLIPTGNNKHIRQLFFDKAEIDSWLMGKSNVSDEFLEQKFNEQLMKNKKK
jgi:predicted DNA-binding transcriptional regulator AlpA